MASEAGNVFVFGAPFIYDTASQAFQIGVGWNVDRPPSRTSASWSAHR